MPISLSPWTWDHEHRLRCREPYTTPVAHLACQPVTCGKKGLPPSDWAVACLWGIFLTADWCKRVQPTMRGTIPGQEGMGCIGKTVGHEPWRKLESNIPQWFLLHVPTLTSTMVDGNLEDKMNPHLPKLLVDTHRTENSKNKYHFITGPSTNCLLLWGSHGFHPPVIVPVSTTELKLGKAKKKCDLDFILTLFSPFHFLLLSYISSLLDVSRVPMKSFCAKTFVALRLGCYSTIHRFELL